MANCFANASPTFQPAYRLITALTNANPVAVTTSFDHDFVTGEIVRIYVPTRYGMHEINHKVGTITVTGDTTFTVDIDTTQFTVFAEPVTSFQCAFVVPIGEVNSLLQGATQNVLRSLARS